MLVKSKLVILLKTLNGKELKRFEEYVRSPFFNKNENVVKLFDWIKKVYSTTDDKNLDWQKAFKKVFPSENADEQKLRYVMSDLTKCLEDFLAYIEYDKIDTYKKHKLLLAYNERKLNKYFQQTLDSLQDQQKKHLFRDVDFYFHQHLIEEDAYLHQLNQESRNIGDSLQQTIDNLDYYYLSNKIRYCCIVHNRQDILQVHYDDSLTSEILNILEKGTYSNIPSISIYYEILMMFREEDNVEHYNKLKVSLNENVHLFSRQEGKDMYVFALNYCIKKLNTANLNYLHELLDLYKALLDKEIIFDEGEILPSDYKNIVVTGLRSGEFDWTKDFIEQYKSYLPKESNEGAYTYNLAFWYYYKKDFSKALKLLQSSDYEDIYFQLDGKALLLRTYYELNEEEPFYSLTEAFTNYLKRNKLISEYQRDTYLNFVRYAKKIMHVRKGSIKLNKEQLQEELLNTKPIASLQWLKDKLDEL